MKSDIEKVVFWGDLIICEGWGRGWAIFWGISYLYVRHEDFWQARLRSVARIVLGRP